MSYTLCKYIYYTEKSILEVGGSVRSEVRDLTEQLLQPWRFNNDSLLTNCPVSKSGCDRQVINVIR